MKHILTAKRHLSAEGGLEERMIILYELLLYHILYSAASHSEKGWNEFLVPSWVMFYIIYKSQLLICLYISIEVIFLSQYRALVRASRGLMRAAISGGFFFIAQTQACDEAP